MKTFAIQVSRPGGPEVLEAREIDLVEPAHGEARIRHTAIGVNFIDVYHRTGLYPVPQHPFTPGVEGAGVVEALGPGVRDLSVGDRVAYASRPLGAYTERRNMTAERLVKLPDFVPDDVAAGVMLKGMTAHMLLRRTFRVESGQTIVVHAAAGGVGSLVVPWARALGANVIAVVGSDEKAERARALGAHHAIVTPRESFVDRVRSITDGRGADVVYDSVGKDTFAGSIECLAVRGMLVSFGQSSGSVPPFELSLLARRSNFLSRPTLFDYVAQRAELEVAANELFDTLRRGVLKSPVERRYRLADAAQAHADLEGRRTRGASILVP